MVFARLRSLLTALTELATALVKKQLGVWWEAPGFLKPAPFSPPYKARSCKYIGRFPQRLPSHDRTSLEVSGGIFLFCIVRYYSFLLQPDFAPCKAHPSPSFGGICFCSSQPPPWPIIPKLCQVTSHPSPIFPYWPLLVSKALQLPAKPQPHHEPGAWIWLYPPAPCQQHRALKSPPRETTGHVGKEL